MSIYKVMIVGLIGWVIVSGLQALQAAIEVVKVLPTP